jgi:hypothetical protein
MLSVRAKLAVFLVAAVVFAPGWGGEHFVGRNRPPAEVGARMLAPTFDEADRSGSVLKWLDQLSPTRNTNKLVPWTSSEAPPEPPSEVLLAALTALALLTTIELARPRHGRAPPYVLSI